jgi:hypothetical protein
MGGRMASSGLEGKCSRLLCVLVLILAMKLG